MTKTEERAARLYQDSAKDIYGAIALWSETDSFTRRRWMKMADIVEKDEAAAVEAAVKAVLPQPEQSAVA